MPPKCILHRGSLVLLHLLLGEDPVWSVLLLNVIFSRPLMAEQGQRASLFSQGKIQLEHKRWWPGISMTVSSWPVGALSSANQVASACTAPHEKLSGTWDSNTSPECSQSMPCLSQHVNLNSNCEKIPTVTEPKLFLQATWQANESETRYGVSSPRRWQTDVSK